jgi:ribosomal protein S18 acetylase RimI-like enzyme
VQAKVLIEFEPASDGDFEALLELRLVAMRESLERLGRFDPARSRARLRASFEAARTRHICVAGRRVGFVAVQQSADTWSLEHLYVHPDAQGRGIGGEVLAGLVARAEAEGRTLLVTALRGSDSNRFYRRHGFVPIAETEWDVHYRREPARR